MFSVLVSPRVRNVNLRKNPSILSVSVGKFGPDTKFHLIDIVNTGDGFWWYKVSKFGTVGPESLVSNNVVGWFRFDVANIVIDSVFDDVNGIRFMNFIGQNEIPNNMGFVNNWFDERMRDIGFVDSRPWCAYYMRCLLNWFGFPFEYVSPSVMNTLNAYKKKHKLKNIDLKCSTVSLAIWQNFKNGKGLHTGHIGLCVWSNDSCFVSIEGNTNAVGSREGFTTAIKLRTYKTNVSNGLRFIGFIPLEID